MQATLPVNAFSEFFFGVGGNIRKFVFECCSLDILTSFGQTSWLCHVAIQSISTDNWVFFWHVLLYSLVHCHLFICICSHSLPKVWELTFHVCWILPWQVWEPTIHVCWILSQHLMTLKFRYIPLIFYIAFIAEADSFFKEPVDIAVQFSTTVFVEHFLWHTILHGRDPSLLWNLTAVTDKWQIAMRWLKMSMK